SNRGSRGCPDRTSRGRLTVQGGRGLSMGPTERKRHGDTWIPVESDYFPCGGFDWHGKRWRGSNISP
ncbi:unnamed protein product, partial [Musa textilis]